MQLGKYDAAELSLNRVLKIKPSAAARMDLANVLYAKGRSKSALKLYDKISKNNPEHESELILRKAECLIGLKAYQAAIQILDSKNKHSAKLDPQSMNLKGKIYGSIGDVDKAAVSYKSIIDADCQNKPKFQAFFDLCDLLLANYKLKEFIGAVQQFEERSLTPKGLSQIASYHRYMEFKNGLLMAKEGRIQEVKVSFARIAKSNTITNSNSRFVSETLAYFYMVLKDYTAAEDLYQSLSRNSEMSEKSQLNRELNTILRQLETKNYDQALKSLERSELIFRIPLLRILFEIINIIKEGNQVDQLTRRNSKIGKNVDQRSVDDLTINLFTALQNLEELYKSTPRLEIMVVIVVHQIILGLCNEASTGIDKLVGNDPNNYTLTVLKGLIFYLQGDHKKAFPHFTKADMICQESDKTDFALLHLSAFNMYKYKQGFTAKTMLEGRYYALKDNYQYRELLGDFEISESNFESGEEHYLTALELQPNNMRLVRKVLNLYLIQKNFESLKKTIATIRKSLDNDACRRDMLVIDAYLSLKAGQLKNALSHISKAMIIPQSNDSLFNDDMIFNLLGVIHFSNKNYEDSYNSFKKARDLIKKNRFILYSHIEFDDPTESEANMEARNNNTGTSEVDGLVAMIDFNTVMASLFNGDKMDFFDELEYIDDYELKRRLLKLHEDQRKVSQIMRKNSRVSKVFKEDKFFNNSQNLIDQDNVKDVEPKQKNIPKPNQAILESRIVNDPSEMELEERASNMHSKDTKFFFDEESESEEETEMPALEADKSDIYDEPIVFVPRHEDKINIKNFTTKVDVDSKALEVRLALHLPRAKFNIVEPSISDIFNNVLAVENLHIWPIFPSNDSFEIGMPDKMSENKTPKVIGNLNTEDSIQEKSTRVTNITFTKKRLKKLTKSFN